MDFSPAKLRTAAVAGLLAVGLGAMGAHGLESSWKATLEAAEAARRIEVWGTASHYHLVHSVVLLLLAFAFPSGNQGRAPWWCFVAGIVIFSGSLYLLCLTGMKQLGAITPIGGLALMAGWLLLCFTSRLRPAKI